MTESEYNYLLFVSKENEKGQPGYLNLLINIRNLVLEGNGMAIIKKKSKIPLGEAGFKVNRFFHVLNLGDLETEFNPYTLTHGCIKNAFVPFFNHIKGIEGGAEGQGSSKMQTDKKVITAI